MQTFPLGSFHVGRVGFGAMQLPGPGVFGPPRDHDQAIAVLRRAMELGINHIDTAQFYGPNVSNELIHEALHPYPKDLALVSKVGARRDDAAGAWLPAQEPDDLRADIEENLRTLDIDRLAAVNLRIHAGDPTSVGPVDPASLSRIRRCARATRALTSAMDSPPGARTSVAPKNRRSASGLRATASSRVSPSHSPKSSSRRSSSTSTGRPRTSAAAAAVSRQRRSGELTIASMPRSFSESAAARASARPSSDSGRSLLPLNRRSGVCSVCPCRSRWVSVVTTGCGSAAGWTSSSMVTGSAAASRCTGLPSMALLASASAAPFCARGTHV